MIPNDPVFAPVASPVTLSTMAPVIGPPSDASIYSVLGYEPKLAFDFKRDYYRANGLLKSFSDAMTFARAGLATMVDSDGLIKWASHNLVAYSEDSDSATKTSVGVVSDAIAAPNGTITADKVTANSATSAHFLKRNATTTAGQEITLAVFAKAAEYDYIAVYAGTAGKGKYFDLASGAVLGNFISAPNEARITGVGDGWYLCEIDVTAATNDALSIYLSDTGSQFDFLGDGSSGVYLWGAHLYRSDLGGMVNNPDRGDSYVPTTSSAVYLPRIGHHVYNGDQWVNKGILVESEARTNLFPYSTPDDTNYSKGSITLTEDSAVSPTGETNAGLLTTSATSGLSYVFYSPISLTTGKATISAYVKEGNHSVFWLYTLSVAVYGLVYFDISDQSIQVTAGATTTPDGGTIEYVGNGWYRISATMNVAIGATTGCGIGISDAKGATAVSDGKTGYFYGVQVEQASTCSSLIPTNGSTVTRAAETVTVPYVNLPWPTPTYIGDELVTNGTFDTDTSGWTGVNAVLSSVSGVLRVADDGLYTAAYQAISTVIGKVYQVTFDFISSDGFGYNYGYGNTIPDGATYYAENTFNSSDTIAKTVSYEFVASSTTTYIIFGSQGTYYSEYDNISVREINPLSVSIAMQGEANYADTDDPNEILFYRWYQDLNNRIQSYLSTFGALVGGVYFYQNASGTADVVTVADIYSPDLNLPFNISSRHGSTFINGAVDGTALTADITPVALPDLSATDLRIAHTYMGTISEFRIWDKDIGDTGIAEATKPSLEPSLSLTFDGQPSSFTNTGLTV